MKSLITLLILSLIFIPVSNASDLNSIEKELDDLKTRVATLEKHVLSETVTTETDAETLNLSQLAEQGKMKFNTFCTVCHKNNFTEPMLAPPMAMVKDHYGQIFKKDKEAFVNAVVAWVKAPNEKMTLMPGAIRNFKIMPPFPLPDEDLKAIATYIFEGNIPAPTNFEEHITQERKMLGRGSE